MTTTRLALQSSSTACATRAGSGSSYGPRLGLQVLFELDGFRDKAAQHISREVDVGRSRLARIAERAGNRLVQFGQYASARVAHGSGIAGDRADQEGVVEVLQAAAVLLRSRVRPGDDQHRCARDVRIGNTGHGIGHTRACRHEGNTQFARQL